MAESNIDKRICRDCENENLGAPGDVVVEEAPLVDFGKVIVNVTIILGKQKPFEHPISQGKENNTGDGENEGRVRGQPGDAGDVHISNMGVGVHIGLHLGNDGLNASIL